MAVNLEQELLQAKRRIAALEAALDRQLKHACALDDQIEQRDARIAELEGAERELTNLQPHIAQIPERDQPFIDSHVDEALRIIRKALGGK